jgi:phosphatidylglycerol:prolipoprotein diacylglycerol transferase
MHPILIDFGTWNLPLLGPTHLFLPTYGVLFATGALVAWWWFLRRARTLAIPEDRVFNLGFYSLLAGILGAKLTLILVEWRYYLEKPLEVLSSLRSAGVLMGGVLCGALAFAYYARRHALPLWSLADAAAAPLAMAQSVGRLGCFSAGCCYGVPGGRLAVTFTDPAASVQTGVPLDTPLFPIQLVQMLNDLVLALVLTVLWRRRIRPAGATFWCYVLLYSVTRGILEFWRGDTVRGTYFGGAVSTSQLLAIAGAVLGAAMLARGFARRDAAQAA